eukprot:9457446-Prorocentrum_lima.AAC.1
MLREDETHKHIQELAQKAHLEVCQCVDLRRYLANRLLPLTANRTKGTSFEYLIRQLDHILGTLELVGALLE